MTEEQKQHYWAMFYCNAYTAIEASARFLDAAKLDPAYALGNSPVKGGAKIADAMLAHMVERWPDHSNQPIPNI